VLGSAAVLGGLLAPWLGAVLLIGRLKGDARLSALWLGALAVGSIVPFLIISQPGDAQAYFLVYGVPGARVLSAWGVAAAWPAGLAWRRCVVAGAVTLTIALVAAVWLHQHDAGFRDSEYLAIYAALVAAAAIAAASQRVAGHLCCHSAWRWSSA
jgi:hypothetical protein